MGSMKGKQEKIDAALGRIADMIPSGNLLAGTDPVGFLDIVAAELKDLRSECEKLREQCEKLFDALQTITETAHQCDGWPSFPSIDLDLAEDTMENFKVQMSKLGAKL